MWRLADRPAVTSVVRKWPRSNMQWAHVLLPFKFNPFFAPNVNDSIQVTSAVVCKLLDRTATSLRYVNCHHILRASITGSESQHTHTWAHQKASHGADVRRRLQARPLETQERAGALVRQV